jgi:H+/Cl- antiporter ClcA
VYRILDNYRRRLTNYESVLAYALLGIVGGVFSGLVVLAFELAIEQLAGVWGVAGAEDFESLPRWQAFALPVLGAVVLGLAFSALRPDDREVGIVHVLSRMHSHYGALPWRNAAVQFIGGTFALATGQSGGREGPGVHLGGAINSLIGQKLSLPNNSLRVLIACGTAGGIAAAFNTPLAGVIFAMEVIIVEYTVAGFIPVMLAAVASSAVSRNFGGSSVGLFDIPLIHMNSLWEIPFIVALGICCGAAMALFIRSSKLAAKLGHLPVLVRFTMAGLFTGSLALLVPEVLGIGYDTLERVLHGQITLLALLAIALCKLCATSFSCGVGMPIGVIAPSLVIGACIGGLMGIVGAIMYPDLASNQALYIVIGMAAAMGAMLNAPLAAILAVIELTQSIGVAMPALLAIVAANLTNTGIFRQRSAHQTILRQLQRKLPNDPLNQLLHRTDVSSIMDRLVTRVSASIDQTEVVKLQRATLPWCLVEREQQDLFLVAGNDLVSWLSEQVPGTEPVDITQADIRRWTIATVPRQATLRQAMDTIRGKTVEAVCVYGQGARGARILQGVVTRESIEKFTLAKL